eukprot:Gb_08388 [translate_table: standard]
MVENESDYRIQRLRSDNGGEFTSNEFKEFCKKNGIRRQLTTPYTPQQNAIVERKNRTVIEMARYIRNSKNLAEEFWVEAVNTAVYLLNKSPTKAVYGITPKEAWTRAKPNIDHLRIFGCVAYAHVPDEKKSKLEDKSVKCVHIGYSEVSKAYKLFDPKKRRIILSRNVVFDEEKVYEDVINDVAEQKKIEISQSSDKGKEIEIQSIPVAEEAESSNSGQQKFLKWVQ